MSESNNKENVGNLLSTASNDLLSLESSIMEGSTGVSHVKKNTFHPTKTLLDLTATTPVKRKKVGNSNSGDINNNILSEVGTPKNNNKNKANGSTDNNNNNKIHNLMSIKKIMTTPMKRMTPMKRIAPSSKKKTNTKLTTTPMKHHSSTTTTSDSTSKYLLASGKKTNGKTSKRLKLTPPRNLDIGCSQKKALLSSAQQKQRQKKLESIPRMSLSPHFLSLQRETNINNHTNNGDHELRSSEMDPSPLQLELPSLVDVKFNANICSLMDNYIEIGGSDFDLSTLMYIVGTTSHYQSRQHRLCHSSNITIPESAECLDTSQQSFLESSAPIISREEQDDLQAKKQAVQQELSNIQDDLTVQGFFREYVLDKDNQSGLGRVETCVFSTEKLRKIIVCFRGSNDYQKKPIQGNHANKLYSDNNDASTTSSSSSDKNKKSTTEPSTTTTNRRSEFEKSAIKNINAEYMHLLSANNLEDNLFTLLKRLSALKPFHDIVITGHTFGASLATIASQKLAIQEPTMRIYCQVFGSPRVGGTKFRQLTHSLPNLNFIRFERNTDPFLSKPEGAEWAHVGHSIMIQSQNTPLSSGFPSLSETSSNNSNSNHHPSTTIQVHAYRFDKRRPNSNFIKHGLTKLENYTKGKIGNELNSYIKDLEKIHNDKNKIWVASFVGEDVGDGICGDDDEIRYLV